ncbi:MAG: MBL fold metallo-hydrolase [Candidatus Lokiarchaeota archaeon]|jgi:7,8-dihydropterin-6-yl-methyl-4-(beta-D-ribofuranosyl)aminobenzene 5'-phosphate synthase
MNTSTKQILIVIFALNLIIIGLIPSMLLNNELKSLERSDLNSQNSEEIGQVDSIEITVLCDNNPNGVLLAEWGLSILIETKDITVLFDTGQSYTGLRENSLALQKDLSMVDFVVISHEHWDHIGGLSYIEEINPGVTVFVPTHMESQTYNNLNQSNLNIIKVDDTTFIQHGFVIIGELYGPPYEHALAINVKDVGLVCIVGCSHPGVENIVEKAIEDLGVNAYMVMGGFHMASENEQAIQHTIDRLLELRVQKIYPIHCSGDSFRQHMAIHHPLEYGHATIGFQVTINFYAINSLNYLIIIIISFISLAIISIWLIRRKVKLFKARNIEI